MWWGGAEKKCEEPFLAPTVKHKGPKLLVAIQNSLCLKALKKLITFLVMLQIFNALF